VTLGNFSQQPDGAPKRGDSRPIDLSSTSLPQVPDDLHSRLLLDAYLRNCERSEMGSPLITASIREMSFPDREIFKRMGQHYRGAVLNKFQRLGLLRLEKELTIRTLHPVIVEREGQRVFNIFVDIVSPEGRSVVADLESVKTFQAGPAAVHFYATEVSGSLTAMGVNRLVSAPAYKEAVEEILSTPYADIAKDPRYYVAFGWIMHAVAGYRRFAALKRSHDYPGAEGGLPRTAIENFRWSGEVAPPTFLFRIGKFDYEVRLDLDTERGEPTIYLHEERVTS